MQESSRKAQYVGFVMRCLPILAFIAPFMVLYYLFPQSFELTWEGRTYYLFFLWLMVLETILNEKELRTQMWRVKSMRTVVLVMLLSLPTVYVVGANFWGWNGIFLELTQKSNVPYYNLMPLSFEYLVFTVLFVGIVFTEYGTVNLKNYSITAVFLGAIGAIYTINNLYPYGHFTPFQIFVPTTTMLAAGILNIMGYTTTISYSYNAQEGSLPILVARPLQGTAIGFKIAWPCSGIESLLLFSITIALFLKNSAIPWKQKTVYFAIGAAVTYVINALRIVTIYLIALGGGQITTFHDYYGQLYSISWIMSYPLLIMASRALWGKLRLSKTDLSQHRPLSPSIEGTTGKMS